jgi:hypothetical protein
MSALCRQSLFQTFGWRKLWLHLSHVNAELAVEKGRFHLQKIVIFFCLTKYAILARARVGWVLAKRAMVMVEKIRTFILEIGRSLRAQSG